MSNVSQQHFDRLQWMTRFLVVNCWWVNILAHSFDTCDHRSCTNLDASTFMDCDFLWNTNIQRAETFSRGQIAELKECKSGFTLMCTRTDRQSLWVCSKIKSPGNCTRWIFSGVRFRWSVTTGLECTKERRERGLLSINRPCTSYQTYMFRTLMTFQSEPLSQVWGLEPKFDITVTLRHGEEFQAESWISCT